MSPRAIRRGRARAEARRARRLAALGGACGIALAAPAAANAATFQVTSLDDSGAGTLRDAVDQANTQAGADTITFAPGLSGTIRLTSGQLNIQGTDGLTIDGPGMNALTISGDADADGLPSPSDSRIFSVPEGAPVGIDGLTLSGGLADAAGGGALQIGPAAAPVTITGSRLTENAAAGPGGAISAEAGTLKISDSELSDNRSQVENTFSSGGAIHLGRSASLEIEGSELTGNTAGLDGGVIATGKYMTAGVRPEVTIVGSVLSDNEGGSGGAIRITTGDLTIEDSTLSGNVATGAGGAISASKYSTLGVDGATLSGNTAGDGGAISFTSSRPGPKYSGTLTADNSIVASTITDNEARRGGGIYLADTPATQSFTVSDSTLSGNAATATPDGAGHGGGLALFRGIRGDFDLVNSTVSGNSADYGGGVAVGQADATSPYSPYSPVDDAQLQNATIADNTASTSGGGIYAAAHQVYGETTTRLPTVYLYSDIVGDNRVGTGAAAVAQDLATADASAPGGGFTVGYSLIEEPGTARYTEGPTGTNIVGQDPRLLPLAANGGPTNTHLPLNISPAIDTGTNPAALPTDQRGLARTVQLPGADPNDGTDMGAVELQAYTAPRARITSGPSGEITGTAATFAFTSDQPGSTFECRLDAGAWDPCTSPKAYSGLGEGSHTFAVRATSMGVTAAPISRAFSVADTTAPRATITKAPKKLSTSKPRAKVRIAFRSDEPGSTFECKVGKGRFKPCASPLKVKLKAKPGKGRKHRIQVRATDAAGNTGPPARVTVRVVRKR